MYNYRRDGITIAAVLDNRTKRADGNYPVRIRVNHNRVRKYLPTGKNLTQEEWDNLSNTRSRALSDIRKSIEESFYVVKENIDALCQKGEFSFSSLDTRLGNGSGGSVNKALEAKIKQLDAEGRIGTKDLNQGTLFILEAFAGQNIPFDVVTVPWLKRCEAFWAKTKNTTTIGMHMRNIRAIMNEAKRTGVIKDSQYPFGRGKYEIKTGDSIKKALSIDHIKQIYHFTHFSETLLKYRDLWLFIYFCNGLNVADMVKLKYTDIIDDEICFVRQKSGLSVSGKGLFCLVPINNPQKHLEHYYALEKDSKNLSINIDPSCTDTSRLRFQSCDPKPYVNPKAVVYDKLLSESVINKTTRNNSNKMNKTHFAVEKQSVTEAKTSIKEMLLKPSIDITGDEITPVYPIYMYSDDDRRNSILRLIKRIVVTQTDITVTGKDWVTVGEVVSRYFGESGRALFHQISQFYKTDSFHYTQNECDQKFNQILKSKYTYGYERIFEVSRKYGFS